MKKIFSILVSLFILTNAVAKTSFLPFSFTTLPPFHKISEDLLPTSAIEEQFYREKIPAEYADAFIYYTKDCPEIRLNFYSIMVYESGNFKAFVNKNPNGTYDYGPSQLNSANLEDDWFMEKFSPKETKYITSKYCEYMVITINFYNDLYKTWGDYSFYAYNGGPKAARLKQQNVTSPQYESLLKNVTVYYNSVKQNISKFSLELNQYILKTRINHVKTLEEEYNSKMAKLESIHIENLLNCNSRINITCCINNIDKRVSNPILYYVKRKEFTDLDREEVAIVVDSIIGRFNVEC